MVIPKYAPLTSNKLVHIDLILNISINRLLHFHNWWSESAMNQPIIDYDRLSAHHHSTGYTWAGTWHVFSWNIQQKRTFKIKFATRERDTGSKHLYDQCFQATLHDNHKRWRNVPTNECDLTVLYPIICIHHKQHSDNGNTKLSEINMKQLIEHGPVSLRLMTSQFKDIVTYTQK